MNSGSQLCTVLHGKNSALETTSVLLKQPPRKETMPTQIRPLTHSLAALACTRLVACPASSGIESVTLTPNPVSLEAMGQPSITASITGDGETDLGLKVPALPTSIATLSPKEVAGGHKYSTHVNCAQPKSSGSALGARPVPARVSLSNASHTAFLKSRSTVNTLCHRDRARIQGSTACCGSGSCRCVLDAAFFISCTTRRIRPFGKDV